MTGSGQVTKLKKMNLPKIDITKAKKAAFLGTPLSQVESTPYTELSSLMIRDLKNIDIYPRKRNYAGGLVTSFTIEKNTPQYLNITKIYTHIQSQLKEVDEYMLQLVAELSELNEEYSQNNSAQVNNKRQLILAQIGLLALPTDFITKVMNPIHFIENVAPVIGLYVIACMQETGLVDQEASANTRR